MKPVYALDAAREGDVTVDDGVTRRRVCLWAVGLSAALVGGAPGAVAQGAAATAGGAGDGPPRLAYLVSDLRIPFWSIMWRGVKAEAERLGYAIEVFSADNDAKAELTHLVAALRQGVRGLVVSPTTSSACVTLLDLAAEAGVPVVISDIGTDGGDYVAYISADNLGGGYGIGRILAEAMIERGWRDGSVGIVAIPQKRYNGQARTAGFMKAMTEYGIRVAGLTQQVDFSYAETFDQTADLLSANPDMRAVWLQGSDRSQGALDAIAAAGRRGEVLLICFDAEPEFLDLIPQGVLVGAAMQQPYLMGQKAVAALDAHLRGDPVDKEQKLPVLAVSRRDIEDLTPIIRRNVLGLTGRGGGG